MPKPVIGLTTSRRTNPTRLPAFSTNVAYPKSVTSAGGLPVLIPLNLSNDDLDQLLTRVDGILLTGGSDVDPGSMATSFIPKSRGWMAIVTAWRCTWCRH